jgi:hypothetical protein
MEAPKRPRWSFYVPPEGLDAAYGEEYGEAVEQFMLKWTKRPLGRPPGEHKWEWVRRYYVLMAEAQEAHDNHHEDGDRPPGDFGICALIAEEVIPEDWAKNPGNAVRKVWNLIRPLVRNDARVLREARSTDLYRAAEEARNRLNKR